MCWIIAWAVAYGALLILKGFFWACVVCLDSVQGLARASSCPVAVGTWPVTVLRIWGGAMWMLQLDAVAAEKVYKYRS